MLGPNHTYEYVATSDQPILDFHWAQDSFIRDLPTKLLDICIVSNR